MKTGRQRVDHEIDKAPSSARLEQSKILLNRARLRTPGGVHSNVRLAARPQPIFFQRGQGSRLWDVDGNEYIDFVLGQGPVFLGHAYSPVVEAVSAALRTGQLFAGQHRLEVELAELVCELVPCAQQVRFSSTGTEAVQAALRIARAATGRNKVLKFDGHYHGWVDSVYLNVAPRAQVGDEPIGNVAESLGQILPTETQIGVIPWGESRALADALADRTVAAVIMEPVPANQAVLVPSREYLEFVRSECDRVGSLLIFDEIITGFRVHLGGAQALLGVTPDLAVLGKAMANGFPIACVAGRAKLFDGVATGAVTHAGTYNANVSSVAAAIATLRALKRDGSLYEAADTAGRYMMSQLRSLPADDLIVQGLPTLFWTGFGPGPVLAAKDLLIVDQGRMAQVSGILAGHGIYATTRGAWYLSAVHTTKDADLAVAAFAAAVDGTTTN